MPKLTIAFVVVLASLFATASSALAGPSQDSIFQDDSALVWSSASTRAQTLDQLQSLGADTLRVNLIWNRVAPAPGSKRKPRFDDADPNAYDFRAYDAFLADARRGAPLQRAGHRDRARTGVGIALRWLRARRVVRPCRRPQPLGA